jgi:NAD(P)H-hydrate epimerase
LEGLHLIARRGERIDAWVVGPGLSREAETLAAVADFLGANVRPTVLDADALQPDLARAGRAVRILTPHAGEWQRIAAGSTLESFTQTLPHVVVAKGPLTRVVAGGVAHAVLAGGPVLSRGGSGDLLAGLIGGLLAQTPDDPLRAAARGALWHALAADQLAQDRGEVAVATGDLLSYLSPALRALG